MIAKNGIRLFLFVLLIAAGKVSHAQQVPEDFTAFLAKFTSSASFQYSRIRFPLESDILLLNDNEEEVAFPFSQEKWPLLEMESFNVGRTFLDEEESYYLSGFVLDEPERKEFEAGYEESDLDLRVVFVLVGGEWLVVDCYNSWYSYDLPAEELEEVIDQVKSENLLFIQTYP